MNWSSSAEEKATLTCSSFQSGCHCEHVPYVYGYPCVITCYDKALDLTTSYH